MQDSHVTPPFMKVITAGVDSPVWYHDLKDEVYGIV